MLLKRNLTNSSNSSLAFLLFSLILIFPADAALSPRHQVDRSLAQLKKGRDFKTALKSLNRRSRASERYLLKIVENPKRPLKERWFSIMALTKLKGREAFPKLQGWSTHPQWFIRLASLKAIGYLRLGLEHRPVNLVTTKLNDPSVLVRDGALEVLSKWCLKESREPMLAMLDDPKNFRKKTSLYIRKSVVKAIGKCGYDNMKVRKKLISLFREKNIYGLHQTTHQTLSRITGRPVKYRKGGKKLTAMWKQAFSLR